MLDYYYLIECMFYYYYGLKNLYNFIYWINNKMCLNVIN